MMPALQNIMRSAVPLAVLLGVVSGSLLAQDNEPAGESQQLFTEQVGPLLVSRCGKCHGSTEKQAELDLTSRAGIEKGGESGPLLVAGKPGESRLLEMVVGGEMPPEGKKPLTGQEIKLLRRWILTGASLGPAAPSDKVSQWSVLPVLQLRCTVCHGTRVRQAELDLRTRESIVRGGKSGPAIVPGKPAESLLLKRVHAGEMPPKRKLVEFSIKPMEKAEIELITRWIEQGAAADVISPDHSPDGIDPLLSAEDREFWSFQPPRRARIPRARSSQTLYTPVDHFIVSALQQKQLDLSPPASRQTLARRAFLDLLGIPPTPGEVSQFLSDEAPGAYQRLVDRLLASPLYGERWGGLWLDVAGYSDSEGIQHSDSVRPFAYRYRDYVIRSWNADKPYSRFLMEQLAGDELADYTNPDNISEEVHDNLVATGFLRLVPDATYFGITNFVPDRLDIIDDMIEVVGSSMMGLTIKCARCHSHKFDPIPQRDYYRLAAIFKGAIDENDWLKPTRQSGSPGELDRYLASILTAERKAWEADLERIEQEVKQLEQKIAGMEQELVTAEQQRRIEKLPASLREDVARTLVTPAAEQSEVLRYLAEKFGDQLKVTRDELLKANMDFKKFHDEVQQSIKAVQEQAKPEPLIRALWDRGEPSPTYILRRGNYLTPGRRVEPGVPSVVNHRGSPLEIQKISDGAPGTGRRLALARWLTQPDHPTTARVIVNRIWHQHFEQGIVATLDNLGHAGARPTHPELLDWLAVELVDSGWSIKHLQRLIMLSAVYRQQSTVTEDHLARDPDNTWLSRMPLRRMDAEVLRDSLLAVAGRLRLESFGPADPVEARADGLVVSIPSGGTWRRSIYVIQRRTQPVTILGSFDRPQMNPNCVQRSNSNVAPQALHLLNNKMVHDLAVSFAGRVQREAGSDRQAQVGHAFLLALGRPPDPEEKELSARYLEELVEQWEKEQPDKKEEASQRALENFCHAVMNLAAFIYID
jgi:cytochrome c553